MSNPTLKIFPSLDTVALLQNSTLQTAASQMAKIVFNEGDELSHFQILRLLGEGAFAKVYLAKDKQLERWVALKISFNDSSEAKTLAALEHESISKIYSEEILPEHGLRLISMQYIPGMSLQTLLDNIKHKPKSELSGQSLLSFIDQFGSYAPFLNHSLLTQRQTLEKESYVNILVQIVIEVAEALSEAHSRGILHLDVKPSNILINHYGHAYLADFNVSLNLSKIENSPKLGGTAHYMSPEQREFIFNSPRSGESLGKLSSASDIYSLAVVLDECLKLREPEDVQLKDQLNSIIEQATQTELTKRYTSISEFITALLSYRELSDLKSALNLTPKIPWITRNPLLSLTLIGAIPQIAATLIGFSYNAVRIVSTLPENQKSLFYELNWKINTALFLSVSVIWFFLVSKFIPYLRAPEKYSQNPIEVQKFRIALLRLPFWGIILSFLGWGPASVMIPYILNTPQNPLPLITLLHFLVSLILSCSIAVSYSFLCHTYLIMRSLYENFWVGCEHILPTAAVEIQTLVKPTKRALTLIIATPLVGALALLELGPEVDTPQAIHLVSSLILFGLFGIYGATVFGTKLVRTFSKLLS